MGTEPFLLSSSVIGVLAQRLVRSLCKACRRPRALDADTRTWLDAADGPVTIFEAVGCDACNRMGYRGRTAIYELVVIDDTFRRLIHDGASEQALEAHARRNGASLAEVGRRAVLAGLTTHEELLRVTQLA
jgi:general secretion pathway protein E